MLFGFGADPATTPALEYHPTTPPCGSNTIKEEVVPVLNLEGFNSASYKLNSQACKLVVCQTHRTVPHGTVW